MVVIPTETPEDDSGIPRFRCRRGFMAGLSAAVGAIFGLEFIYVLLRFMAPWGTYRVARPVRLATAAQPKEGECVKVKYGDSVVLVIRDEGEFKAFFGACTHLNCLVAWQPATKQFFCACHDGFFDRNGKNVAGPPPSPLLGVDWAMDGDDLIIGS